MIDNLSGDGSLEMLAAEFPEAEVIANPVRLGFGANHNQVIRRLVADGWARHVLVLNDDTERTGSHPGHVQARAAQRYLYLRKHLGPRRAQLLSAAGRSVLLARSIKLRLESALTKDQEARNRARHLLTPAQVNPRRIRS